MTGTSAAITGSPCAGSIGFIKATVLDLSAHVAHLVLQEALGNRCAREATAALVDCLHRELGVIDIWAVVGARNRRSIAVLEGLGFQRVGARSRAGRIHDTRSDELVYCLSFDPPSFQFLA